MPDMKKLLQSKRTLIIIAILLATLIAGILLLSERSPQFETEVVKKGTVAEIVNASGTLEAVQSVSLSFEVGGTIQEITVTEGSRVTTGDVLARLNNDSRSADLASARASLAAQEARLLEMRAGMLDVDKEVIAQRVSIARLSRNNALQSLEDIQRRENLAVNSARQTLLSSGLEAKPVQVTEGLDHTAPTITGSYLGEDEGEYQIELYRSETLSGFSFRYSGLEQGVESVSTSKPVPLGTKGLFIQFSPNPERYWTNKWTIEIPNKRSGLYTQNSQIYERALENRDIAIREAKRVVTNTEASLAQALLEETASTAGPRAEQIKAQEAVVAQTRANLRSAEINFSKTNLSAPFAGTVKSVRFSEGENVTPGATVITIASENVNEVTLFIPEVDIARIAIGDLANVRLDAFPDEVLEGEVVFVSSAAETRDGIVSFKTKVRLAEPREHLRSGMSAEVDIHSELRENTLSVPGRAIVRMDGRSYVRVVENGTVRNAEVSLGLRGVNGRVEVLSGLVEGDEVIIFIREEDLNRLKKQP
jgi:RND family efflux transporter MFP subunit